MKTRRSVVVGFFLFVVLEFLFFGVSSVCARQPVDPRNKIKVFVSILPQAYFVNRVGGDRVDISVMVGPGHSPATYEPVPSQIAALSKANLYFRIGVPFETVWIDRVRQANPDMRVIDSHRGIGLLAMKVHSHDHEQGDHHQREGLKDPHVWLSLRLVKVQAENIYRALISEDPAHRSFYDDNLRAFHRELDILDADVAEILKDVKVRKFMAFHPAWSYFARDYGLEQIPIEIEGKEPTARTLSYLIEQAKEEGIKVIFVQKQFSKKSAETVASAIHGKVIQIDPLAGDYLNNMRKIARSFAEVMQ